MISRPNAGRGRRVEAPESPERDWTARDEWSDRLDLAGHAVLERDPALAEAFYRVALAVSYASDVNAAAVVEALSGEAVA